MQRLLKRQLERIYGKSFDLKKLPEKEIKFIERVSFTYDENEKERKFLEHTIDLNSKELNEKNKAIIKVLSSLNEAQRLAHTGSWLLDVSSHHIELSEELYRIYEQEMDKELHSINQCILMIKKSLT